MYRKLLDSGDIKLLAVVESHARVDSLSFHCCGIIKRMSSDPLANFSCLDELVQVIYQSIYKFVVLSTVSQDEWHVHLGLAGSEGRWWHGSWKEEDIHRIFVCIHFYRRLDGSFTNFFSYC